MDFEIIPATREDAPFISQAILAAVGREIALGMAGSVERLPLIEELFANLAASEHSQYSYRNTLLAVTPDGHRAGAAVSYDGAKLHELREAFVSEANRLLGWNLTQDDFTDETSADEFYLDSLMVLPEYRRQGLGTKLIGEARKKADSAGKPLGLLVDFDNQRARSLYSSLGFTSVGHRPFAGTEMEHMQLK